MTANAYRNDQIVFTNKAKCLDCNRCVRVCPVKAIKMKDGQAQVDPDRCIVCGTCIKECPQKAKTYRNDLERVKELLNNGVKVAVIVAPSIASVFNGWKAKKIPSVLRSLGFINVAEAAYSAGIVSKSTKKFADDNPNLAVLASSCPAFVNYIEKYRPEMIPSLADVISPMVATGKIIKETLGTDVSTVFVGPCIAKKYEAERKLNKPFINTVLTFEELLEWLKETEIDISKFEDSEFDLAPSPAERLFPLSGGLYKAGDISTDPFSDKYIPVTGYDEIVEIIDDIKENKTKCLAEPLFCKFGCINGPVITGEESIFERKRRISEFSNTSKPKNIESIPFINMTTRFTNENTVVIPKFSEDEILSVLEKIGKSNPEDRLDCTSCGYPTCKDKAIAVMCGMADEEMCVPWMRKRARTETDKIIENSPNGIVMLNEKYEILNMNTAFRKMFMCSNSLIGKSISILMDPEPFVKVVTGSEEQYETTANHEKYNLICQEIIYALKAEKKYVGLFVNLTNTILNKTKLDEVKRKTVTKATELLEHQIEMAQKIAKLLGESTAQGEELVSSLMEITDDERIIDGKQRKNNQRR